VWLRKSKVPGSAPGGLVWETLDDVVEVSDELGLELLGIRDAGFSEAPAPARGRAKMADAEQSASAETAEVVEAPAKRKYTRKATTEVAE